MCLQQVDETGDMGGPRRDRQRCTLRIIHERRQHLDQVHVFFRIDMAQASNPESCTFSGFLNTPLGDQERNFQIGQAWIVLDPGVAPR